MRRERYSTVPNAGYAFSLGGCCGKANASPFIVVSALSAKGTKMDNVTLIRIIAGIAFVIVLLALIQRRRKQVN